MKKRKIESKPKILKKKIAKSSEDSGNNRRFRRVASYSIPTPLLEKFNALTNSRTRSRIVEGMLQRFVEPKRRSWG